MIDSSHINVLLTLSNVINLKSSFFYDHFMINN